MKKFVVSLLIFTRLENQEKGDQLAEAKVFFNAETQEDAAEKVNEGVHTTIDKILSSFNEKVFIEVGEIEPVIKEPTTDEKTVIDLQKWFGEVLIPEKTVEVLTEKTGKKISEIFERAEFRKNAGCYVISQKEVSMIPVEFSIRYV